MNPTERTHHLTCEVCRDVVEVELTDAEQIAYSIGKLPSGDYKCKKLHPVKFKKVRRKR